MLKALFKAVNDLTSPELRAALWKSIALSIVLFAALWFAIEFAISAITLIPWPWLITTLQVATGLGLFAAFFFLMAPVTAIFAGLFQDGIAAQVERRHYPTERPGRALSFTMGMVTALKFGILSLGVNIVVLPLVLFAGFGAILILAANSYVISREYFEMTAARYMPLEQARSLRRENALRIWISGIAPGLLAMIPFINFVTPVFATSYFMHYFKSARVS